MKNFTFVFLDWLFAILSTLAGLLIALWSFMLVMSQLPDDTKWLLRLSGIALAVLCILYLFPLRYVRTSTGLTVLAILSVGAAITYAAIYNRAELNDPYRSEGEFGAAHPFGTAIQMCVLPILRTSLAWWSRRMTMPNQSSDPTLASVTPPAGQESGHR